MGLKILYMEVAARATSKRGQIGSAAYGVLQVRQKGCWPMLYGANMALSVSFEVHVCV